MKYIKDISDLKLNNTVVTIGKFDGNHIGHKYLFDTVVRLKEYAMDAVIFTFSDDIKNASGQDDASGAGKSIFTNFEKENYSYPDGIDYVIECRFTEEIKNMYPEEFIEKILAGKLGAKKIVVGNDFCFGKDRSGDVKTLFDLSDRFKYEVFSMEKILYDGVEVSSTYIKEKIIEGDIEAVCQMLGEPFSVTGEVVHGKAIGREIGFPTINFISDEKKILPPNGVYATKTIIDGKVYPSISNIGKQPTIDEGLSKTIETNIFDLDEDLYGKTITVEFYKFIRPEKKFTDIEELKAEIAENKEEVKKLFGLKNS